MAKKKKMNSKHVRKMRVFCSALFIENTKNHITITGFNILTSKKKKNTHNGTTRFGNKLKSNINKKKKNTQKEYE